MLSQPKCVLLIDDDETLREALSERFLERGYEVLLAGTAECGLALARAWVPDLVCVDLTLPRRSGFEVCELVRADPMLCRTRIVVMSARDTPVVRTQAAECGADAYVAKPIADAALFGAIELVLRPEAPRPGYAS